MTKDVRFWDQDSQPRASKPAETTNSVTNINSYAEKNLARGSLGSGSMDVPRKRKGRAWRMVAWVVALAALVVGVTLGLRRLKAAAPSVDRAGVWTDTVKRGTLIREVQGQGTLVPEEIRWLSAPAAGRVEKLPVKAGTTVTPDTILVELSNTDVELAALEAQRQLASSEAELANLAASLDNGKLAQESTLATLKSDLDDATRRAKADQELADKGFLSKLEMDQSRGRAAELAGRLAFEEKRLAALQRANAAQLDAQRAQLDRLRSIAEFRKHEVDNLKVRAGFAGVVQDIPLQVGQSVTAGSLLAKVVNPDKLKAELRIPETQVRDVTSGLLASIDTRNGVVVGKVSHVDPAAVAGTVKVDVEFDRPLPKGARVDLTVEGTIQLEKLDNVLQVGRPAFGEPNSLVKLWRLTSDGDAVRVPVQLGRTSVKSVEIVNGLNEGDIVVLSDMSQWDNVDRIRLH
jgi:RND family efflux transporter MFP subunit